MLRNSPGHVKDSVYEATEVLSGMLNTKGEKRPEARDPTEEWGMTAGGKNERKIKRKSRRKKRFLWPLHRILKGRGRCRSALRPRGRVTLSGCRRRTVSLTPRS